METEDPAAVVQDVIRTQRTLFKDIYGQEHAVPQLLALYKEVQQQYESGKLQVPDDVTLLFADDNFGTIRRLPCGDEAKRKGGAGIYYHFEYVGDPRSYKWVNSNSLGKTWHQLQQAYHKGARQVWVFNVGDIKPQEVPLTMALSLTYDIQSVQSDGLGTFLDETATKWFGPALGPDIASSWLGYDRLVSLRRHEHMEPASFSPIHYEEAETILTRWDSLHASTEAIYARAPAELQPALFQLVTHPVKASHIFTSLQILLDRNQTHALQRRNTTNALAQRVLRLFDADFSLSEEYHTMLDGRWRHIMAQPHYGFGDTWHAPSRDMISGLCYVQQRQNSNPIVGQMGVAVEGHVGVRPGRTNEESDRTHPSRKDLVPGLTLPPLTRYGPGRRYFDIFTRGSVSLDWHAGAPHDWVQLSVAQGVLDPLGEDVRVYVSIDWDAVPPDFDEEVLVDIRSNLGDLEHVHLPVLSRLVPVPAGFASGFVEGPGYLSIPASKGVVAEQSYIILPDAGRTEEGSVALHGGSLLTRNSCCLFLCTTSGSFRKLATRCLLHSTST